MAKKVKQSTVTDRINKMQQNSITPVILNNDAQANNGKTLLDDIINFQIASTTNITPVERTKNIIYLCKLKDGAKAPNGYIEVFNANDIATYTDDKQAITLFNYGMNKIILAFMGSAALSFAEITKYAYTLIISSELNAENAPPANLNTQGFDGVVVYSCSQMSANYDALVQSPKTCVVLSSSNEALACAIFANFVSQNNLTDMQYKEYPNFTPVLSSIGNIDEARNKGYTFIAKDKTTVEVASLMYFRAGNLPIASIYITENLKQDIQIACFDMIANNNLTYNNIEIGVLMTAGEQVIERYKTFGLIRGANFTIPSKESQENKDVIAGMLSNVTTKVELNSSIWRLKGTIETSY